MLNIIRQLCGAISLRGATGVAVSALLVLLLAGGVRMGSSAAAADPGGFDIVEATISEMQAAMEEGTITSRDLVEMYLARIEAYDQQGPSINAIITINPNALAEADALDVERETQGARGPLHGIPVIIKDNYDTADLPTAAGSKALEGSLPPDDGFQVQKLRQAGAIILAKANMHELAWSWETFSSLGGQTLNPYDLTRNPGGSSGGTGASIAASFAAVGMGTDTCGSIRVPSSHNSLVGLRATKGLSSVDGIVPLALTQDVGGPLARTVTDLALVLDATAGFDPADPITALSLGRIPETYTAFLDEDALEGARIGLLWDLLGMAPEDLEVTNIILQAAQQMTELGASVRFISVPAISEILSQSGLIVDEFRVQLDQYLAGTPGAPRQTLQEIVDSGLAHEGVQFILGWSLASEAFGTEAYKDKLLLRDDLRLAILVAMAEYDLDALIYPTVNEPAALIGESQGGTTPNCRLSARSGLPAITVPAGFTTGGLPVGVELLGRPFDEPGLIALAYSYEQGTQHRQPPASTPPLLAGGDAE